MSVSAPSRDESARELVVIVDDDPSVLRSLDRLIRSFGYRTRVFASAEELLESTAPDGAVCFLLDVRMPDMDGLTLQRRLAERGSRTPVVFITARASDEEERRAWAAGAIGFLRKPVGSTALRQALDRSFGAARPPRGDRDVE